MIRNVPATEIKIGSQIVERDGAVLDVVAVEVLGNRIRFTMDSIMQSEITGIVSRNALVRVAE